MAVVLVDYDCGYMTSRSATLRDDQTLLANPALADTMLAQMDAEHDENCKECRDASPDPADVG